MTAQSSSMGKATLVGSKAPQSIYFSGDGTTNTGIFERFNTLFAVPPRLGVVMMDFPLAAITIMSQFFSWTIFS